MIDKPRYDNRITIDVDTELNDTLKKDAKIKERTISSIIRVILNAYYQNRFVELPSEYVEKLETMSEKEDRPVYYILRRILREYFNNHNKENAQDKEP